MMQQQTKTHSCHTCHGKVRLDRLVHGQGQQGCYDGAARRGAVLGDAPRRHMHMDSVALEVGVAGLLLL